VYGSTTLSKPGLCSNYEEIRIAFGMLKYGDDNGDLVFRSYTGKAHGRETDFSCIKDDKRKDHYDHDSGFV